ncbi:MAG: M20/M25/M40 family metallo-hydrolase, partial [Candidatus Aminicenantes bacterium]|nr:M20/M25/M40 family metallo-hydrolase [Candidatus Aminicenantes bacterium]
EIFSEFTLEKKRIPCPGGDILEFSYSPDSNDFIVLLAHMDTVKVSETPIKIKTINHQLHGSGSYDMKNGIALFYYTLKAIQAFNLNIKKKIKLIFTPDEETGSQGSLPYLLKECQGARAVLLPEPSCPGGGVKIRRKGVAILRATLRGRSAHSGIEPEKGRDANRGLIDLIRSIDDILSRYPGVSFNPGIITGGYQTNMICGESVLQGELRSFSGQDLNQSIEKLKKQITGHAIRIEIKIDLVHPPLEFNGKNQQLFDLAKDISRSLGNELSACSSGGSSDGSNLSHSGIPVLDGLGMSGSGAHSLDEHVDLSDFPFRATLITSLCQEI